MHFHAGGEFRRLRAIAGRTGQTAPIRTETRWVRAFIERVGNALPVRRLSFQTDPLAGRSFLGGWLGPTGEVWEPGDGFLLTLAVRVDVEAEGGLSLLVPHEFLDRLDVDARLDEVGAESVSKRVEVDHESCRWGDRNDQTEMDRIPYMAPGLVGKEKAARGKTPTDVWWHTIVPTNGKERTGYPTQKPLGILKRIVKVHSRAGDLLLDFFAGSGTLGEAAAQLGREYILVDDNPVAAETMARRLAFAEPVCVNFDPPHIPQRQVSPV